MANHLDNKLAVVSNNRPSVEEAAVWKILETVPDPEVPVLSVLDLGIVRDVKCELPSASHPNGMVHITITPTYSGCPAMDAISMDIRLKMMEEGYSNVKIISVLSPAWTTDWMTTAGKEKLKSYGIAPPQEITDRNSQRINKLLFAETEGIECPHCHSTNTKLISEFGSTACKALYQCQDCKEPFDYFKCH
jgi:ring-1,2-phenylacetyl-CoA epoxidase subunit PaaD